ncbi:MAG TPA: hypothetical protein PLP29_01145 [Candidatus Ozemobacteraceae bacterium]|nr:hypothetical protein [Candidatus Ozemobacteraceae bacterium]
MAALFPVLLLVASVPDGVAAAEKRGKADRGEVEEKKKPSRDKEKGAATKSDDDEDAGEDLFLREGKENQKFLPDIFRCPECGYEQDEPDSCPDHDESVLVLVRSKGQNPLEPPDVDGNEDIVVDIPLTGLSLKKAPVASGTAAPAPVKAGTK